MEKKQPASGGGGGGGGGDMKRSASELALEEFLNKAQHDTADASCFFADVCFADLGFKNREMMNGFLSNGRLADTVIWSQNLNISKQNPTMSAATMDSQSSVCVGSPTSGKNSKTGKESRDDDQLGRSSSSDDDDLEIDDSTEHTNDPIVLKRIRRMVSNRESARRSRRRKQAHMADLELQVDQLRGENATLFKQLTDATHQYRDADTNNRVLKSDVEALRAKVKLAEDMVARGSLSCSLNQLLQNHLAPQQQQQQQLRVANVSPTVTVRRDHTPNNNSSYAPPGIAISNNSSNGIISDTISCVSEIWP